MDGKKKQPETAVKSTVAADEKIRKIVSDQSLSVNSVGKLLKTITVTGQPAREA